MLALGRSASVVTMRTVRAAAADLGYWPTPESVYRLIPSVAAHSVVEVVRMRNRLLLLLQADI